MRFDSQLSRLNCQTFSAGFNSGHQRQSQHPPNLIGIITSPRKPAQIR